jgi:hypothetical protein
MLQILGSLHNYVCMSLRVVMLGRDVPDLGEVDKAGKVR